MLHYKCLKTCTKCGAEKSLEEYSIDRAGRSGRKSVCRTCLAAKAAKWTAENPEKAKQAKARWFAKNREREMKRAADWKANNPERAAEYRERYRGKNREYARDAYRADPEASNAKRLAWRRDNPERSSAIYKRSRLKRLENPQFRLECAIRNGVYRGIIGGGKGGKHTFDALGYTIADLRRHIERQFVSGMSWQNYGRGEGKWHIDHILPLVSFEYQTVDCPGFKAAWALSNLRPLWEPDNLKKRAQRVFLI